MQIAQSFSIDLTQISGKGEFRCPKCGVEISPDDKTENTYTILETIMKGIDLDRISLKCNKCDSIIQLTGFQGLNSPRIAKNTLFFYA
jgi:hypothetical protein